MTESKAGGLLLMGRNEADVIDLAAARRRRDQSTEPWLKKELVAKHFDVHPRTLYRWVQRGCPVKRLPGGTMRFQIGPVTEWVEKNGA